MKRMRIRLAGKIRKNPERYSYRRLRVALKRLGWKETRWVTTLTVPLLIHTEFQSIDQEVLKRAKERITAWMESQILGRCPYSITQSDRVK